MNLNQFLNNFLHCFYPTYFYIAYYLDMFAKFSHHPQTKIVLKLIAKKKLIAQLNLLHTLKVMSHYNINNNNLKRTL